MTGTHTPAADWSEPIIVAFAETPAHRRRVRPLRQQVDFHYLRDERMTLSSEAGRYDHAGKMSPGPQRPGRLLNVHV